MKPCPCRTCEERTVGCHGGCVMYKEWRQPLDAEAEDRKKDRPADDLLHTGARKRLKTLNRR